MILINVRFIEISEKRIEVIMVLMNISKENEIQKQKYEKRFIAKLKKI
jgi:hypothetical protein